MISLYPFHIHLSHIPIFSHIHIFHIFLCSYFYRFRWLSCHLFFHFSFLWRGKRGMFFLWFFGADIVESFCPVSTFRPSLRFAPRFASRSALRHAFRPAFRPAPSFRLSVWACRVGGSWDAPFLSALCGGRSFVFFRVLVSWGRCGGVYRRCGRFGGWRGGVRFVGTWRCGVSVGGSMMPCRAAWCVLRDEGLDAWRDGRRDDGRAVFASSFWSFPCCHYAVWGLGEFSAFPTVS